MIDATLDPVTGKALALVIVAVLLWATVALARLHLSGPR